MRHERGRTEAEYISTSCMAINPANQLLLLLLLLLLFLSWLHTIQAQEVTGVCKEYKTGPCLSAYP